MFNNESNFKLFAVTYLKLQFLASLDPGWAPYSDTLDGWTHNSLTLKY
jgi:hypothetical protein